VSKILKKLTVVLGIIWIIVVTAWLALSIVLSLKSDELGKYLILQINQIQSGEIAVDDVKISPIFQFPHFSAILNNVTYYEHKSNKRTPTETPIVRIDNFFCGLQLINLLKGEVNILEAKISGGELDLIVYPDSSLNLVDAVKKDSTSNVEKKSVSKKQKSGSSDFSLVIKKLTIENLKVNVKNQREKKHSSILIKNFDSDLLYSGDKANFNFTTSILIEQLKIAEDKFITNKDINLKISSQLDRIKGLQIEKGKLEIENTSFLFSGNFNPADDGDLHLNIESDGSLNILSLFVNEDVAKNLNRGEFMMKGFIEGKVFSEFPLVDVEFGFKNVELVNPITKRKMRNLNLKGFFNSGRNKNLSDAKLTIDTLFTEFPNGELKLSGIISDFTKPKFDVNFFLDADLTGLEDLFDLGSVDSIKGRLSIVDRFKGVYYTDGEKFESEIDTSEIKFYDFGFNIPNTIRFDKINGHITKNGNEFILKDLMIESESTDFTINGGVKNILYLLFDIEKEITANLSIKSNVFDLPNFLEFDPSIKRDFPHRILDLDLIVNASTTTSKALHFKSFPEISFNIKKLKATAEGFLPTIDINSGKFKISESALGFHMDFDHFKTEFLDGRFDINGRYNSSSYQPYYIKTDIEMDGIKISKFLYDEEKDSIPEIYDGKMYGSLFLELQFADDSTQIKLLNITNGNLEYAYSKDTIVTRLLNFKSTGIDYKLNENPNPLATLYARGNIKADKIRSSGFDVEEFDFNFLAKNGEYIVETKKPKVFGTGAKGQISYNLKPFIKRPQFSIYCNISSFNIQEMLHTFLNDTTISGNLSMLMDISGEGSELKGIVSNLNGKINLSGKNLIFYGVDADKVIEEFQRSQNFNLVDAGALLLAGPVGLVVTKGTDFAKIFIMSQGKSSQIKEFVSNWKVTNGSFLAEDVALSTLKNKVAAKGWIDISTDSLEVSFAVINDNGCSIFQQDVFGDLNKPTLGKVKVVSTLLAPVTNLYKEIMNVNCQAFYNGSLISKEK